MFLASIVHKALNPFNATVKKNGLHCRLEFTFEANVANRVHPDKITPYANCLFAI